VEELLKKLKEQFIAVVAVVALLSGGFAWVYARQEILNERERSLLLREHKFEKINMLGSEIEYYNKNFADYSRHVLFSVKDPELPEKRAKATSLLLSIKARAKEAGMPHIVEWACDQLARADCK
jgi:nicotinic acid phosphoribosyltransferase